MTPQRIAPPAIRATAVTTEALLAELAEIEAEPGGWFRIHTFASPNSAKSRAKRLRTITEGRYDFTVTGCDLNACFPAGGEEPQP